MTKHITPVLSAALFALGSLGFSTAAHAQQAETAAARPRPGRAGRLGAAGRAAQDGNPRQQALAKQVRAAFAGVVRRELNLNDDQARRLQDVDARYQKQRGDVGRDERAARTSLRDALEGSAAPDQAKIDGLLSQLVKAQHRRADILESEQKDLSAFLTPVQRAKFLALRDQLARRIAQLRGDAPPLGRQGGPPPPI